MSRALSLGMRWLALLVLGCSSSTADPPSRSGGQLQIDYMFWGETSRTTLLIIDDVPSTAGATLRETSVDELRESLHQVVETAWGSCSSGDPAEDHYTDERVVVAFPSAPKLTLLGPDSLPGLAWITETTQHEEVEAMAKATSAALGARLAQGGETYQPIRTATNATELLLGLRAPTTADEQALLGALDPRSYVRVLVASTRDDEGADTVESLKSAWSTIESKSRLVDRVVVGPFDQCAASEHGHGARLFEWGEHGRGQTRPWPCATPWFERWSPGRCVPSCLPESITELESGVLACRIWVDQLDPAGCDPVRGRRDPEGAATWVDFDGETLRRCELVQLTGLALTSCQSDLGCKGCQAGWCATKVPELLDEGCSAGTIPRPFRWIGGAIGGAKRIAIQCDLE